MGRLWRAVGLVALMVTPACWLQAGAGPQRQGFTGLETEVTAANVVDLVEAWTATGAASPREALVDGPRAYIRTAGEIRALDVRTGTTVWSTADTIGAPVGSSRLPAVVGDTLYVPDTSSTCWLSEIDASTGELLDRHLVGPEPATNSGCLGSDALAIGSTVALRWSYIRLAPYEWCESGGILSMTEWGVTVIDVEGGPGGWNVGSEEPLWRCGVPEERLYNQASSGENGSVVFTEGGYVRQKSCTGEGCPEAWDAVPGFGLASGEAPVVLHNGDVAVMAGTAYPRHLVAIDGTTHTRAWSADVGSSVDRPLASDPDTIFATTADGRVVAFPIDGCGAETCSPSWTATLPSPASARPSIAGDVLYVGSEDGTVAAFDAGGCGAPTCTPLWTGTTPTAITGAPVVSGGRVIVGSSNGTITAFALPDPGD